MSSRRWAAKNDFSRAHGFSPRFSPDGNWIAYGVAEQGGGRIYVAPAAGGPATPVAPDFYRAQAHVWSPDSRHLLFWAQRDRDAPPENNIDWYVAAIPGGTPVPVDARHALAPRAVSGRARAAVSRCLGGRGKPHSLSWPRRRLLEHVAGGARPRDMARPWCAAAGDIRHHRRSRSVGQLRRTHGVHQPDDGSRYLEPADRRESRASRGNPQTRHARMPPMTTIRRCRTMAARWCSVRGEQAFRRGAAETGCCRGDGADRLAEDHYPAVSHDGTKVAYSFRENRQDAHFCRRLQAAVRPSRSATIVAKSRSGHPLAMRFCMSRRTIRRASAY